MIDLVRQKGITCIQGNHDEGIGHLRVSFCYSHTTDAQKAFGKQSICLSEKAITPVNLAYLINLPFMLQMEYRFPFHTCRIG
ncbi:hypothetical protein ACQ86N_02290 [Puia sp. P3]|uniref:hypothetical protein n=1 Tax=Puia sp. P3 TaxID=3423952 RepID=UPI003D66A027